LSYTIIHQSFLFAQELKMPESLEYRKTNFLDIVLPQHIKGAVSSEVCTYIEIIDDLQDATVLCFNGDAGVYSRLSKNNDFKGNCPAGCS